ncbi:MAG: hypothetical protein ACRD4X_17725 [Candidatus Acidiferrales bacterium]
MRTLSVVLALLLIVFTCPAQVPAQDSQSMLPQTQSQVPAPASPLTTLIVPAGTQIPVVLSSPISSKSAKPGKMVRVSTSFPITVGSQVAIPVGTYFEGVIDKVTKSQSSGTTLRIHFTRVIFANGYTVDVDATNQSARAASPDSASFIPASFTAGNHGGNGAPHLVLAAQQLPPPPLLPPMPHNGLGDGPAIGIAIAIGTAVAIIIGVILAAHHHGGASNAVLFDAGWQFNLVLQNPLTLNAASIAAATSGV